MNSVITGRTRVKICGITNEADALAAIASGADALGFNTYPGSKRYIDLNEHAGWIQRLPAFVTRVAVTVDMEREKAEELIRLPFIDMLQFHGNEDGNYCGYFASCGLPFIKALALKNLESVGDLERFGTRQLLLDAYSTEGFGGLGKLIDLDLAARFARAHPQVRLILSGGLNPENVREAVALVRPYAVDVASGVEASCRKKDPVLMARFVHQAALACT